MKKETVNRNSYRSGVFQRQKDITMLGFFFAQLLCTVYLCSKYIILYHIQKNSIYSPSCFSEQFSEKSSLRGKISENFREFPRISNFSIFKYSIYIFLFERVFIVFSYSRECL